MYRCVLSPPTVYCRSYRDSLTSEPISREIPPNELSKIFQQEPVCSLTDWSVRYHHVERVKRAIEKLGADISVARRRRGGTAAEPLSRGARREVFPTIAPTVERHRGPYKRCVVGTGGGRRSRKVTAAILKLALCQFEISAFHVTPYVIAVVFEEAFRRDVSRV